MEFRILESSLSNIFGFQCSQWIASNSNITEKIEEMILDTAQLAYKEKKRKTVKKDTKATASNNETPSGRIIWLKLTHSSKLLEVMPVKTLN